MKEKSGDIPTVENEREVFEGKALEGIRVLEMGSLIGAPFCGTLMAEFGAEVIKIEDPQIGDSGRYFGEKIDAVSSFFAFMARNKKCITMDLRLEDGQDLFKKLVPFADVIIENFMAGTLNRWNLGYDVLSKINPNIIVAHVSGYGQYGPYKDRPAFDRIATAFAGQDFITGFPNNPPTRPGGALADYIAGLFCTIGVMFALHHRDVNGGRGQEIDLGLYEGIFRCIGQAEQYGVNSTVNQRTGNSNPFIAPAETFMTIDGQWIVINAGTDAVWKRLLKIMEREDLNENPKFNSQRARAANEDELHLIIAEWIRKRSIDNLIDIFEKGKVPSTKINSIEDIFKDPHFHARGNIIDVQLLSGKRIRGTGIVPKLSLTPGKVDFVAPHLGSHNKEIYMERLNLSDEEYNSLKYRGII